MSLAIQLRRTKPNLAIRPRSRGPRDVRAAGYGAAEVVAAFEGAWRQFIDLIRGLDPADGSRPVPHLDWTVAETAAHVLTVLRRAGDPRRASSIAELSALNQLCLEELRERDLQRLADLLEGELADAGPMLRALPVLWRLRVGRWVTFKLHLGVEADLPTAFSYGLTDLLVHGYDIATAVERPWTVDPMSASVAVRANLRASAGFILPGVLNGPAQRAVVTFADGHAVEINVGGAHYSARPVARRAGAAVTDPFQFSLAVHGRIVGPDEVTRRVAEWFGNI